VLPCAPLGSSNSPNSAETRAGTGSHAGAREKLFKTLRVSNSNGNYYYYDNTDERYTTSNDLTAGPTDLRRPRP
jgi:hypothetical protein